MILHPHTTCSVVVLWGSCPLKNRVIQYTEKQMDHSLDLYTYRVSCMVVELISSAIGDLVQGVYHENSSSAEEGNLSVASWEDQTFLSHGALLAKSCQAAMELARHNTEAQTLAYQYGKHLALGHKLNSDLQPFVKSGSDPAVFSLDSAPVVFHRLIVGPERWLHQLQQTQSVTKQTDYSKLRRLIKTEQGVSQAADLCSYHGNKALEAIRLFPLSEARSALENIASAIMKF
ncbi:hypothetical protein NFI96_005860 [Prochilodus magdalenae]|nr:hypothetical protein NFI96_005860 [Prochilodus magdalenae]